MDESAVRTAGELLGAVEELLGAGGEPMEARWIAAHVTAMSPGELPLRTGAAVTGEQVTEALRLARRRRAGEPLQYVLGSWSFRRLELRVDHRALVPRPETEQVVELALAELCRREAPPGGRRVAVDLGTGSGAIALSLAVEGPGDIDVWATDASPAALALAGENVAACRHAFRPGARVVLAGGSWYEALPDELAGCVDLVVSNPPYVSEAEWRALDPVVRDHEPRTALVPGPTGWEAPAVVVGGAVRWLRPGGSLVVEIGAGQGPLAERTAVRAGLGDVAVLPDLAGRPRALVARRPVR